MIVVGASVGGVQALQTLLSRLPASLPTSIAVALHRHRDSDLGLIATLQRGSALKVLEAVDKQLLEPGCVYVAPADYHLLIDGARLALSIDDPVRFARPSIDVLFESAAAAFGADVVGVLLSGANEDGALGLWHIAEAGGVSIVQDPATARHAVMPMAGVAQLHTRARVLDAPRIASYLLGCSTESYGVRA
jgi:two-component system chemotaxis response regulator CheB